MSMHHASAFKNPIIRWIDNRLPIFTIMKKEYIDYPMPRNVNYLWSFGGIAIAMLIILMITGIMLAMHYNPSTEHAFDSVDRITRDVNYGWLLRSIHANGASFFFIAVYIHTFRGLYYGSYKEPRELLWILGIVILFLMILTAFLGYVLPWGQMSFWAATVITNLFSAFPIIGDPIVTWLWGGFSIDNPTLNRFFALHYLMPFVILAVVLLHVSALHIVGSNNPLGVTSKRPQDYVPFHPYATIKDLFAFIVFLIVFTVFVFFMPHFLSHPDNFIPANPLVTPTHIVPEWYFLPFYAILRSIPDKLLGVLALFSAIGILFLLPWLDTSKVRSCKFRPIYQKLFWVLVADCLLLGWSGSQPAEGLWLWLARLGTFYYFVHFLILMPLIGKIEKPLPLPYDDADTSEKEQHLSTLTTASMEKSSS